MKVTFKNIGSIKDATFDLNKNLTIFIGPNNTGKTYASYCLYGLSRYFLSLPNEIVNSSISKNFDELFSLGEMNIDLQEIFTPKIVKEIFKDCGEKFKDFLPQLFGIDKDNFTNSSIHLFFTDDKELNDHLFSIPLRGSLGTGDVSISLNKNENEAIIKLQLQQSSPPNFIDNGERKTNIVNNLKRTIIQFCLKPYKTNTLSKFIPAERIGIAVFGKDLFSNRFTKTNEFLNLSKGRSLWELMHKEFNTYSKVIQDALQDYDQVTRTKSSGKGNNDFNLLANELENKILKGSLVVNSDGDILYNVKDNVIKIQATGSIIKSLSILVLYLRYLAYKDQILIIDEPELSLHPDNQRLVARILAKLSKMGVKVIVSTHSDYFIRELNNLMMLNKDNTEAARMKDKYGYDESEILDYSQVGAYLFKDNDATEIIVTERGMEAATIDDEINKQNNTANDIYWTLFED